MFSSESQAQPDDLTPLDVDEAIPSELQEAFDVQEQPEPTLLELLTRAKFELAFSPRLMVFADSPQGKATAYILDGGLKSLIKWEWHYVLQRLVARMADGKVLWARCEMPMCEEAIYFFQTAHRYTKKRYLLSLSSPFSPACNTANLHVQACSVLG
jgi:hypothetical protein